MNDAPHNPVDALILENAELRARLEEAEETLAAIRSGDVDALIVGEDVYTLDSANAASNRLRKDVLAQMQDAVLAVDGEDHVIFMNAAAERQYRRSASETLGCPRHMLFSERWPDEAGQTAAITTLERTGSYRAESLHLRFEDNQLLHVEATVTRLLDSTGGVIGLLSVIRDISDRIAAERKLADATTALRESQTRLQFTLDAARIGEWDFNIDSGVAAHSLRHDRCFGYAEPVIGWSLDILIAHIHPEDRAAVRATFLRSVEGGQPCRFECRVIWPDGSLHWIEVHGSVYDKPGAARRMLGIIIDSTDRKHAEEALREADRRKDEFLATLAHELRNPLAPIRNAVHVLRLTRDEQTVANARDIIDRQLRHMVHLVDDLLDVSRISQGKIELRREHVDVATVVQVAIETSRPLIDEAKHRLIVRLPPPGTLMVDADVTRLCQITANLLNNAAKYTPEGGTIEVAADREGESALITVRDSGVGIRVEMLPRLFDLFSQVDRTLERAQGGLGIGLALVKQLVEMHGGTVEAQSEGLDKGCRFLVRVPLSSSVTVTAVEPARSAPNADRKAPGVEPAVPANRSVLVVDDNVDSAESLAEVLRIMGHTATTAHDGLEAVRAASEQRPTAIVLDIGLPGLNGYDAARRIRQLPGGSDMLLIALSGWGQEADRLKSQEAGFDHHFAKPVAIKALLDLLTRAAA